MLSRRRAFHAGNHADALKHLTLIGAGMLRLLAVYSGSLLVS